jgi:hypothetical protein
MDDYEFAVAPFFFRQEVDEALKERAIDDRSRARTATVLYAPVLQRAKMN